MRINGHPILTRQAELLVKKLAQAEVNRHTDYAEVRITHGRSLEIWLKPPKQRNYDNISEEEWLEEQKRQSERAAKADMTKIAESVAKVIEECFGFTFTIKQAGAFSVGMVLPEEQTLDYCLKHGLGYCQE